MNVTGIQPKAPKLEAIPVEQIAHSKALDEKQKVTELTRQFEAVLLRQILSEAHKPVFKSNLEAHGGVSSAIYKDMMITQLADTISSSRAVGLAKSLEAQVTREPKKIETISDATTNKASSAEPRKAKGL